MIERLIEDIASGLGQWAYLLVAFMAMAETAAFLGFVAPGEFTIIFGGVLAGEGTLSIQLLIGITWVSCVIGDAIGFYLGRRLGRDFVLTHGPQGAAHRGDASRRSRTSSEDTAARRSSSGAGSGLVRPLMPFTGRRLGHELPALPALRHPGRRPVERRPGACSATSSGRASSRWRAPPGAARSRSRSCWGCSSAATRRSSACAIPSSAQALARWLDRQTQRPLLRPLGWVGRAVVDRGAPVLAVRAAAAVGADRSAAALPRRPRSPRASSASS